MYKEYLESIIMSDDYPEDYFLDEDENLYEGLITKLKLKDELKLFGTLWMGYKLGTPSNQQYQ